MAQRALTSGRLALRNLQGKPHRLFGLTALVALLSACLFGGLVIAAGLGRGIDSAKSRLGADIMVVPLGSEKSMEGALLRGEPGAFYFTRDIIPEILNTTQGIESISPQLFIASMDSDHCAVAVQLIGYDPETDFVVAPWITQQLADGLPEGQLVIGSDILPSADRTILLFGTVYKVAALLGDPVLLVADESTGDLDAQTKDEILAYLQLVALGGSAVLIVSHETGFSEYGNRFFEMKAGILTETTVADACTERLP